MPSNSVHTNRLTPDSLRDDFDGADYVRLLILFWACCHEWYGAEMATSCVLCVGCGTHGFGILSADVV